MAWEDTGVEAGTEVEAAKASALAAFMAAPVDSAIGSGPAVPPQISRTVWTQTTKLSAGDVVKLKKVVNAAIMDATLKHIGPVSSDGSVTIGIQEVGGIQKLDLRATSGVWEHVTVNPSVAPGLNRSIFRIVWQDSLDVIPVPLAIWVKVNAANTAWEKIWPVTADDHLIKARVPDATTVGGAYEKTADSETVTREVVTIDGVERVRFNAVPPVPASGGGSWLYTGSIRSTLLLDPVVAFIRTSDGSGWGTGDGSFFNILPGGVSFEKKTTGALFGLDSSDNETIALQVGDRVAFFWDNAGDGHRYNWVCEVTALGGPSTKAVLTKTDDELAHGTTFRVAGTGAKYEDWYWAIWNDDPLPDPPYDLTWVYDDHYNNSTTYNLLTSVQVAQSGSVTRETSVTIPGGTSGGTLFSIPTFEMLSGVDVSKIPKGVVNYEIKAYVVSDDPAATVFIRAHLSTNLGIDHNFAYADTNPIHNTSPTVLRAQGTIPADIAVGPTDKLSITFYGYSNSASAVTIRLVYNDASHSARVQTPLEAASYGTLDHQLLTMVSRGFAAGQEVAAATYRHPMASIEPGLILGCMGTTVPTVDGLLTLPPKTNAVRISGAEMLLGISIAGITSGTVIYLTFEQSRMVRNGGTPGTGFQPPSFQNTFFAEGAGPFALKAPINGGMVLELSGGGSWIVLSAPWVEPQRALWPSIAAATINTTTAPGLLELPEGCPGTIYVTGTELRAITVEDADGNAVAGPLAGLKLFFANRCTLYHLDALSGWDAGLAARAAKLDLLPPDGAEGSTLNVEVLARHTYRLQLDTFGEELLWIPEVSQ